MPSSEPAPRKEVVRPSPVLGVWKPTIGAWLEAYRDAPCKQRTGRGACVWHPPGAEGEVDFGQLALLLDGVLTDGWMCVPVVGGGPRLSPIYMTQAQQAFLDGHVRAFEHMGGVPGQIRYDNSSPR